MRSTICLVGWLLTFTPHVAQCLLSNGSFVDKASSQTKKNTIETSNILAGSKHHGVLHFLFLLRNQLPHPLVWTRFFEEAPAGSWKVWAHCSLGCKQQELEKSVPDIRVVPTVPSSYCTDLVSPMAQLTMYALKERAPHGVLEKFIFLSDSTLPMKPFFIVHRALTVNVKSEFSIPNSQFWATAKIDGKFLALVRSSQWSVLNRDHAERFVAGWVPVRNQDPSAGKVAINDAGWTIHQSDFPEKGQSRNISRRDFSPAYCADSEAVFATVFGAFRCDEWPPKKMYFQGLGNVDFRARHHQGRLRTFFAFEAADSPLFMKLLSDTGTKISPGRGSHPATFIKVSEKGMSWLRRSPYLFGRKFAHGSVVGPRYFDLVLSKNSLDEMPIDTAPASNATDVSMEVEESEQLKQEMLGRMETWKEAQSEAESEEEAMAAAQERVLNADYGRAEAVKAAVRMNAHQEAKELKKAKIIDAEHMLDETTETDVFEARKPPNVFNTAYSTLVQKLVEFDDGGLPTVDLPIHSGNLDPALYDAKYNIMFHENEHQKVEQQATYQLI